MATAKQSKGLGRGLSSLMGEAAMEIAPAAASAAVAVPAPALSADMSAAIMLPLDFLVAGKYQPRRHFEEAGLNELAESIARHGIMQPIMVRVVAKNRYEIIAGERRWRAARIAKQAQVPVIIRELSDTQALELALIENIQRSDLNPLEEASGYQRLMDEFGYTQEKLSGEVGKSRSHIANLLRLLKLPDSIKARIDNGQLTMGHARALLMAKDPEALAEAIVASGLSVRQAEEWAKNGGMSQTSKAQEPAAPRRTGQGLPRSRAPADKSEDVVQLENMLAESLGLRVSIDARGGQAGEVIISYETLTQLDEILRRLGGGA
jgi:ParB family chromosome partitioning protein